MSIVVLYFCKFGFFGLQISLVKNSMEVKPVTLQGVLQDIIMWHHIVYVFSWLIQYIYGLTAVIHIPNYGLAIILMTLLIKVLLFPLTNMQMKSMRAMQEFQPQLKVLQDQYKDDPKNLQSQIMKLYEENGINPLSGCLPMLVQMPILIAFYQAMSQIHYANSAHAGFLFINNLSNVGYQEGLYGLILPLLSAITTYYQQKISTVDTADPTQKAMLLTMPLFIGWMAYKFQAGLALYWVTMNLFGIIQQLWINKHYELQLKDLNISAENNKT